MDEPLSYTETVERFSASLAQICGIYGLNPLLGRLYGILFLAPEPMSLEDLAKAAGAAKSTVSVAVRKLETLKTVRRQWKKGDRRDYYEAVMDPVAIFADWLRRFVLPELQVSRQMDRDLETALRAPSGDDWPDAAGLAALRERAALWRAFTTAAEVGLAQLLDDHGQPDVGALASLVGLIATPPARNNPGREPSAPNVAPEATTTVAKAGPSSTSRPTAHQGAKPTQKKGKRR